MTDMLQDGQSISLSLPAAEWSPAVVRGLMGSLGASFDLSYEDLDDLRLAVDEACGLLIDLASGTGWLEVAVSREGEDLEILSSLGVRLSPWPPLETDPLPWVVMEKLVDICEAVTNEGRSAIKLVKRAVFSGEG
jgi:serine/threonine-protein kinase RsbW